MGRAGSTVEDGSCAEGRAGGTEINGGVSSTWPRDGSVNPEAQDKRGLEVRAVSRQCLGT